MRDIEKYNAQLSGVLPKTYELFASTLLKELLKKVSEIPAATESDTLMRIVGWNANYNNRHRLFEADVALLAAP